MEKYSWTKSVFFRFYILCENFSKIGPIIKKILKFWDDPLKENLVWETLHALLTIKSDFEYLLCSIQ